MLLQEKIERARKLQQENIHPKEDIYSEYSGEKLYEPTIKDELEKGDMIALMLSGLFAILPLALLALGVIVLIAFLFFRII